MENTVTESNQKQSKDSIRLMLLLAAIACICHVLIGLLFSSGLINWSDFQATFWTPILHQGLSIIAWILFLLGPLSLFFKTKSHLWLVASMLCSLRITTGMIVFAFYAVSTQSLLDNKAFEIIFMIIALANWGFVGVTLIIRRHDTQPLFAWIVGIAILVETTLWMISFISKLLGIHLFEFYRLTYALSTAILPILCVIWLRASHPPIKNVPQESTVSSRGQGFLITGAIGSFLMTAGMAIYFGSLRYGMGDQDVIIAMILLGVGGIILGFGFLGQTRAGAGVIGMITAIVIWAQVLLSTFLALLRIQSGFILLFGLLGLATIVLASVAFFMARKLASPKIAIATGVMFALTGLFSIAASLVHLAKRDLGFDPILQLVFLAILLAISMATFSLATIHQLLSAIGQSTYHRTH